jgi:phage-related protein
MNKKPQLKTLRWLGSSRKDVEKLPAIAQQILKAALFVAQWRNEPGR